jgi:hypothetical protein
MPGRTPSWYSDPDDATLARWHDGQSWTDHTMVIADWTSPEPPPPPAGWSPDASPTEGLVPAFGPRPAAAVPESAAPVVESGAPDVPEVAGPAVEVLEAADPEPPTPEASDAPAEANQASGVRIDAPTAGPPPAPEPDDGDEDLDEESSGPISGSVAAVGPEAPGIDWGEGPQSLKPLTRPSGWHLDEDGEPSYQDLQEQSPHTLPQRYLAAPLWVRIGLPVAVIALVALLLTSVLGGSDDDGGSGRLFSQRDGTLDAATLDEKGMDDALTKARENGVPADISDKELAPLIKGVCTAAKRSVVSLSLSQALADTGLPPAQLGEAATAIANGSLEYCPDQQGALGQVVTVLVSRTQRILATTTTSSTTTTTLATTTTVAGAPPAN